MPEVKNINSDKKQIHKNPEWIKNITEPCVWNITGYKNAWKEYPDDLDFLSKKSIHYQIKMLEKNIYFEFLSPFLKKLKKNSLILDAGCGIGRIGIELAKFGHKVYMADACEANLEKAAAHLKENRAEKNTELYLVDISNLSMFKDNTFDMTLAIEAICYCSNPEKTLKELMRVTKKGGLIVISVEGKYGSIIADENISLKQFDQTYFNDELRIKNHTFTQYFSKDEIEKMVKMMGVKILCSQGCMYVPNGIFHKFMDMKKLSETKHRNKLLELEKICRNDLTLNKLARVWVIIGKVNA